MQSKIETLLSIASPSLGAHTSGYPKMLAKNNDRGQELCDMLRMRNGFFTFESALHIFPLGPGEGLDLETWNSPSLWISEYGGMADNLFFFGEDTFGQQFAIHGDSIVSFDPETGVITDLAPTLEHWAKLILADYEVLTGYPLIHEWQQKHGLIPPDHRLGPRVPFVVGGEYSLANLYLADSVELMRFRASLARQIRDLPDGTPIKLKVL